MKITLEVPIPALDDLQKEINGLNLRIHTLESDKATLQREVIEINEQRIVRGFNTFSNTAYYALRSQYKIALRELHDLQEAHRNCVK